MMDHNQLFTCDQCGLMKTDLTGWVCVERFISPKESAKLDFCGVDCFAKFVWTTYGQLISNE